MQSALLLLLTRPLPLVHTALASGLIMLVVAFYCTAYNALSGRAEPLAEGLAWALVNVLPWFWGLEAGKRLLAHGMAPAFTLACILPAALIFTLPLDALMAVPGLTSGADGGDLVRRLPYLPVLGLMLLAGVGLANRSASTGPATAGVAGPVDATLPLPPDRIDLVRAAGNYVELVGDGRPQLLRLTMKQAEEILTPHGFLRIHRSHIVKASRITAYLPGKLHDAVRLADGQELKVGESYRLALTRLPLPVA